MTDKSRNPFDFKYFVGIWPRDKRSAEQVVREIRDGAGSKPDNPDLDGTDAAHPAWWRGHDHGSGMMTRTVLALFDEPLDGPGVFGNPELELIRQKIRELRRKANGND